MCELPDNAFDLAIVDPPYGIGNFVQKTGNVRGAGVDWNENKTCLHPDYFKELARVSVNRIIWGANYYNCFEQDGGAVIWVKNQPMPEFSKAEIASSSFHKRVELYEQTWTNYVNTKETKHPCEKPVQLYAWLLQKYAQPGQTILDTHLGSGSIAIACLNHGFNLTACELDADYFKSATERIQREANQGVML